MSQKKLHYRSKLYVKELKEADKQFLLQLTIQFVTSKIPAIWVLLTVKSKNKIVGFPLMTEITIMKSNDNDILRNFHALQILVVVFVFFCASRSYLEV